jgi:glycosyltransferase involved in cell wall biosynthesis
LESKIKFKLFSTSEIGNFDGGLRCAGYFKSSFPDKPLLTVITVVYNGEKHLEQTIQSVINQSYNNVEYLVIDGYSTDSTKDIIYKYQAMIDYWVSERDKGIADAMNKGLSLATGDYVLFLHADDYLVSEKSVETAVKQVNEFDILLFDILYGAKLRRLTSRGFGFWMNFKTGVYHQAALCRLDVFKKIGNFDTDFKIGMDYDFFLRAYRQGFNTIKVPFVLSVMRDTGISSQTDWASLNQRFNEEKKIHNKNCNSSLMAIMYKLYWKLYIAYRKYLRKEPYGFN